MLVLGCLLPDQCVVSSEDGWVVTKWIRIDVSKICEDCSFIHRWLPHLPGFCVCFILMINERFNSFQ